MGTGRWEYTKTMYKNETNRWEMCIDQRIPKLEESNEEMRKFRWCWRNEEMERKITPIKGMWYCDEDNTQDNVCNLRENNDREMKIISDNDGDIFIFRIFGDCEKNHAYMWRRD